MSLLTPNGIIAYTIVMNASFAVAASSKATAGSGCADGAMTKVLASTHGLLAFTKFAFGQPSIIGQR